MGTTEFTDRELDVMSILWERGSGTVAEVRERLADELAYTSVLWVLQTLEEKGHVRHEREGRAYRYFPAVAPEEAGRTALRRIVDKVFGGSAEMLLAQLVSQRAPAREELERMRDLLERRLEGRETQELGAGQAEGGGQGERVGPSEGAEATEGAQQNQGTDEAERRDR